MTTFSIDVCLRTVSSLAPDPTAASGVAVVLAETPAPIRACLAKNVIEAAVAGKEDEARTQALESLLISLPAADGWGFAVRQLGHRINIYTGEWTPMAGATSFVLTKDDAPYRQTLIVQGVRCVVEYEVCVTG
jgi:hypothetical protein